MHRISAVLATSFVATVACAVPAQAASGGSGHPHFIYATPIVSGQDVTVSFKEAGVGAGASVNVSTTGTYSFTLACINGGSKHPKAANKTDFSSTRSASGTFSANAGGNVEASLTLTPPSDLSSYLSCPPGQTTTQLAGQWTDLSISDTTNGISLPLSAG